MDTLTHLVAGALTPLAFRGAPKRTALVVFGILAGELPDVDVFFGGTAKALLSLHRGITHAVIWQPVMALMLVLPFYILLCRPLRGKSTVSRVPAPPVFTPKLPAPFGISCAPVCPLRLGIGLGSLFLMALVALYTHLYLDCMTTFGTQIFLPFSDVRVAFPAIFIIDLLLTLPACALLIAALVQKPEMGDCALSAAPHTASAESAFFRAMGFSAPWAIAGTAMVSSRARTLARIGLVWILLYPLCALAINHIATAVLAPRLAPEPGSRLILLTEPFSPFVWKAVVEEANGKQYRMATVRLASHDTGSFNAVEWITFSRPDAALLTAALGAVPLFQDFLKFCPTLVTSTRPTVRDSSGFYPQNVTEHIFMDLRYIISPRSPARSFGRTDTNFVFEIRANSSGPLAYRFLNRGKNRDALWVAVP